VEKSRPSRLEWSSATIDNMILQTIIEIIVNAGYEVRKTEWYGDLTLHYWFGKVSHAK
jgi:hypothetical protein